MLFHSVAFLIFLPIVLCIYWALSGRARLWWCLFCSMLFYGWWDVRFLTLIGLSISADYFVAIAMNRSSTESKRKRWLAVSVAVNLGTLGLFKYFDFFSDSLSAACASIGWQLDWPTLHLVLPIGISFYTFQTLSYSIDVYRKAIEPERDFVRFATYVAFFPQLVAGPIVRARDFLPQLATDRVLSFSQFHLGFGLMLLGFFKKVVIADNIAPVVDHLFASPELYTAVNTLAGIVLYAFQIYGDFSGYSDIAIGVALMMGFVFPVNFRFPYFSRSFSEFWNRWHITLSHWLRDYLYIALGGNRSGRLLTARNLMVTMALGGLWHGASVMFIGWGVLHGALLIVERVAKEKLHIEATNKHWVTKTLFDAMKIGVVFACVSLLWVVFRSQSVDQAVSVFSQLPALDGLSPSTLRDRIPLLTCCLLVGLFVCGEILFVAGVWRWFEQKVPIVRIFGYAILIWMIALFGKFGGSSFIYFQF